VYGLAFKCCLAATAQLVEAHDEAMRRAPTPADAGANGGAEAGGGAALPPLTAILAAGFEAVYASMWASLLQMTGRLISTAEAAIAALAAEERAAAAQQADVRQLREASAAWVTVSEAASQLLRSACLYFNALAQASVAAAAAAAAAATAAAASTVANAAARGAPSFQAFAALRAMVLGALDVLRQDACAATALAGGDAGIAAIAAHIASLERDIQRVRAALLGEDVAAAEELAAAAEAAAAALKHADAGDGASSAASVGGLPLDAAVNTVAPAAAAAAPAAGGGAALTSCTSAHAGYGTAPPQVAVPQPPAPPSFLSGLMTAVLGGEDEVVPSDAARH